jgi:hypothetical protein
MSEVTQADAVAIYRLRELAEQMDIRLPVAFTVKQQTQYRADLRTLITAYESQAEDAARFQALMRCGRIEMQGSSGVDPHTGERNGNNVHFGAEFWPEPIEPEWEATYRVGTTWGRACLRALADAILEHEAALTPATEKTDDA